MEGDTEETPRVYAVRVTETARRQIEQEHDRQANSNGLSIADEWQSGILASIRGLATYPERCTVASENDIFQQVNPGDTVRVFLYRRTRMAPVWRILFSIHEADALDPPVVRVELIRHGSQTPLTEWPIEAE